MPESLKITVVRSRRRSLSLHIESDGTVEVRAPFFALQRHIDQFVREHRDWIDKHVHKIHIATSLKADNEYLFLGQRLKVTPGNYTEIRVEGEHLFFPQSLLFRKEKEIDQWYQREARRLITAQVEKYSQQMGTEYRGLTFSDTTSQWGRCSHDNRLQFSWRLIMAPVLVLNYVVIHELAHTMEKNHSRAFWSKVRQFTPSYRQQMKWLKDHGRTLHNV
ncbi:MAG: SprT family zinc-dependent metalloprotease [Patescibacteria group bacterium]